MIVYTTHRCPNCDKLNLICFDGITYYNSIYEFVCECGQVVRFGDHDNFIPIEECPEGSAVARRIN